MNDEPIPLEDEIYEEEIEVEEEPSVTMAMWGEITGDIDNQTDLKEALDAKQDNLTQAQLDAVNSGIDSTKVATYDGYQAQINTKASQSALDAEAEARRQADSTLQGNIDAEETARKASDKDIQDVLDGETLARQNADIALGGRIDTEIHDRRVADIGLQGQIDAITSKSDVVDVVATYADLQAYDTQHLGDNDVIKVLDDETHGDALTYYRWSKTNQTWTFIGQEAPYYSKSQTDTLLLGKQNTIDSSHKLSADLVDDTSTTNKFVTAQDKTNWNAKQDALTAGTGIDITSGVISTPAIVPEVVTELPTTGAEGKLYLTPKAHTTSTASGNPIEATITAQAGQLESFQLDGDTFQQSYNGRNLIDMPIVSGSLNGVTWVVNDDGSITLNGTATANVSIRANGARIPAVAGETYTLSATGLQNIVNFGYKNADSGADILVVTPGSPVKTVQITKEMLTSANRLDMFFSAGKSFNNQRVTLQLEKGSTATAYEPFVGGQPSPNPSFPQQIQTVTGTQTVEIQGKNLFDGTIYKTGYVIGAQGEEIQTSLDAVITNTIQVEPDTTYTASIAYGASLADKYLRVAIYTSDMTFISRPSSPDAGEPVTFTTPSNARYIRLSFFTPATNAQVELGSTASDYAPYSKQTLPLDLGNIELCGIGDNGSGGVLYKDRIYKDGEEWKVHKAVGKAELWNGTNWRRLSTSRVDEYRFSVKVINSDVPASSTSTELIPLVSNYWLACTRIQTFRQVQGISTTTSGDISEESFIAFIDSLKTSNIDGWKTWLATNKPVVYYQSTTPTDTTITDQTLIAQLEAIRTASLQNGTNTITNTATGTNLAGDMEIGYFGFNPTNCYDKFIWLDLNNNYEQIGGE